MVMADSEFTGRHPHLSAVPPLTRSDLEADAAQEAPTMPPPAPSEAAPKRSGRPKGVKNGQGKGARAKADLAQRVKRSQSEQRARKKAQKPAKKAARAVAKAPQARAAAPAAAPKDGKTQRLVRVRSKELQAHGDALDAPKALKKIQRQHQKWQGALAEKADVSKECGDRLKSADAAFQNAMETSLPVGVVEALAYKEKLDTVTMRWQDLQEAKAFNIEEKKRVRDSVKETLAALNEALEESRQPSLPGVD